MSLYASIAGFSGMAIGATIGGLIASPFGMTGFGIAIGGTIGGSIGGMTGAALFPDKVDVNHPPPPQPHESRVQFSTFGASIPIAYHSQRLAGNVIYMQPVQKKIDKSRHRQDGVRYYQYVITYTSTFAVSFCEGPIEAIARIWVNGGVFVDFRDPDGPYYPSGSTGLASGNLTTSIDKSGVYFSVYYGDETQSYDATLASILGTADTPAYRGIVYIVFKDFPVGEFSGMPKIEIETTPSSEVSSQEVITSVTSDDDNGFIWFLSTVRHDNIVIEITASGRLKDEGFIRFNNITVPNGSRIVSAYLYLSPTGGSSYPTETYIYIEDVDNAAQISSVVDFDSRTWSSSYVSWPLASAPGQGNTSDLKDLVQAVVNRAGWASGNSMQFKLSPKPGQATDKVLILYDYTTTAQMPQLIINYGYI